MSALQTTNADNTLHIVVRYQMDTNWQSNLYVRIASDHERICLYVRSVNARLSWAFCGDNYYYSSIRNQLMSNTVCITYLFYAVFQTLLKIMLLIVGRSVAFILHFFICAFEAHKDLRIACSNLSASLISLIINRFYTFGLPNSSISGLDLSVSQIQLTICTVCRFKVVYVRLNINYFTKYVIKIS